MKKFRLISLLTVLTIVVNVFSVLVLTRPVSAMTIMSATFNRLKATTATDNIVIAFTTTGTGAMTVTFPAGFTGTPASAGCTALGLVLTCATSGSPIIVTGLTNPGVGTYTITMANTGDAGQVQVPIVDSDEVNVTGYILSAMMFDLDTSTDNRDCAYNVCLQEAGGAAASNYTVDLGNLTLGAINKSGGIVLHADGVTGAINYINFDLSTNAANGAVVTMVSVGTRPTFLDGPGTLTEDIPSVADGATMTAGTAGWGYRWYNVPTNAGLGTGATQTMNASCLAGGTTYCAIPLNTTAIYTVTKSAQEVRGYLEIAAAINGTMVPGTYNDVLRFIATATY